MDFFKDLGKLAESAVGAVAENAPKAASVIADGAIKAGEVISDGATKAAPIIADGATKAGEAVVGGVAAAANAVQDFQKEARRKDYSPVFPDELYASDYDLPNIVVVDDGDARKGVDVCDGAVGWLQINNGTEILHLYEEAVESTDLTFVPYAECHSIYIADPLDKNRLIKSDSYFEVLQKEKISELRNVAHLLGATECTLESHEEDSSSSRISTAASASTYGQGGSFEVENQVSAAKSQSILFSQKFEGNSTAKRPELYWFQNDREIQSLIEMRCSGNNVLKEYSTRIDTAAFSAMSTTRAAKIDAVIKGISESSSASFSSMAESESKRRLIFNILFE